MNGVVRPVKGIVETADNTLEVAVPVRFTEEELNDR
jgi:hypothetical protein